MSKPVLQVSDLVVHFYVPGGVVKAVDGIDFEIGENEIVTIVGESGSGKSVTALAVMGLISKPGKILAGQVRFGGQDLLKLSSSQMRKIRGRRISMIFQNPYAALHPFFTIGDQLAETIRYHLDLSHEQARSSILDILERIGVEAPASIIQSYPFQISAGVCQRVMLAMALLCNPELLVADEPTTNLDALAQSQILDLIRRMRQEFHMSVLLITHDFGVVSRMSDRVVVMYAGEQRESGTARSVLSSPCDPYSIGLINSVPTKAGRARRLDQIPGDVPDVMRLPPGCKFRPRCQHARDICRTNPPMVPVTDGHAARCWLLAEEGSSHIAGAGHAGSTSRH